MTIIDVLQHNAVAYYGVVAFLGLMVGSFLNVVIHRLPIMMENDWREGCLAFLNEDKQREDKTGEDKQGEDRQPDQTISTDLTSDNSPTATQSNQAAYNLAVPRSRCPNCNQLITAWQNIPIISYLLLQGKCGNCKTPISMRYPLIEAFTALLSIFCIWHFGPTLQGVAAVIITWCLIALSAIDFDTQLLPDSITLPLMWLGLLASLLPVFVTPADAIIGAAAGYGSLWLVYQAFKLATGKEGMGFGDFKLLAALGAWLGWQSLLIIVLLSSLVGAVVGITLIVARGRDRQIPIPFGPYLAAAGWLAMIWGPQLSSAYNGLFL